MKMIGKFLTVTLLSGAVVGCSSQLSTTGATPARLVERRHLVDVRTTQTQLARKSMPKVVAAVGRPDRQAGNDKWDWWIYEARFYDPITGRTLPEVTLVFFEGHLVEVTF
jgi:hypothetical protein